MRALKYAYETIYHKKAPYYFDYTIFTVIMKPIRKWITNVVAANCPFNCVRIFLYRVCGFKIGRHTFIGMRCYLDDMCYDLLQIGDNVTVSYGVYFACHGKNQKHYSIVIEDGVYIGMRASVMSNNRFNPGGGVIIGGESIIGACTLVNRNIPAGTTVVGVPCHIIEN